MPTFKCVVNQILDLFFIKLNRLKYYSSSIKPKTDTITIQLVWCILTSCAKESTMWSIATTSMWGVLNECWQVTKFGMLKLRGLRLKLLWPRFELIPCWWNWHKNWILESLVVLLKSTPKLELWKTNLKHKCLFFN